MSGSFVKHYTTMGKKHKVRKLGTPVFIFHPRFCYNAIHDEIDGDGLPAAVPRFLRREKKHPP
jgi:hypothetical protein